MSPALLQRLRRPANWIGYVALFVLCAGPVLVPSVTQSSAGGRPVAALIGLAALGALFARRRFPLAALAVAGIAGAAAPEHAGGVLIPALVILYTIATQRPWPAPAPLAIAVVLAGAIGELLSSHPYRPADSIGVAVECGAAVALGLYVGARRAYIGALRDRADRAELERELLTDTAVAEERVRIAQDLHDVVAHTVSLMVVGAQALGATVDDPRVLGATDAIADLGRQAMTEMHRTLRLLRDQDGEAARLAPQPSLDNLDKLIEQSRASGMDVELTVEGVPRPLAQTIDLSAFRIVQEALTNVIKHAGRARTRVTVGYRADGLELRITDTGDGRLASPLVAAGADGSPSNRGGSDASPGRGHGVIGMRERAALFGGTLTAAPRIDQGFEVKAVLPYSDPES